MRRRSAILLSLLVSACATGELEDLGVTPDAAPADAAPVDAQTPVDATALDVPTVDVAPDRPDVTAVDGPVVIDGPTELFDDVQTVDVQTVDVPAVDVVTCAAPQTMCGDACVDLQANAAHCGACGRACLADERCTAGLCTGVTGYRSARNDPAGAWVDACAVPGHQTVLMALDNGTFRATLPFRFRYWGTVLPAGSPVIVTSNGYVTFQDGAPTPANGIIPNHLDGVDAVIAVQWRDLRTRDPGVCIATVGNDGARRFLVQWVDARYFTSGLSHLTMQIALNETSHAIDLNYDGMTLSEPATVALEDWSGARSMVPFTIPQPIVFSNTRVRFTPQ